jgi:tRNA-modifying protein YgfZ
MRKYYPLDSVTVIGISGKDRIKWFNNLITNDLKRTAERRAVECFATDVKGRTLAHGIVYQNRESLVFFSWGKDQSERLIAHWDRYIIREDVTLVDESSRLRWAFSQQPWLANELQNEELKRMGAMEITSIGVDSDTLAIAFPAMGDQWLLIGFSEADSVGATLPERDTDLSEGDKIALEARRIAHRWPLVGIDFDEKNLPQELDRNEMAISFHKGCYLGQETVARLDALGQVQKKLVLLSIEIDPTKNVNELIQNAIVMKGEEEAGRVTSISRTEPGAGTALALAYIRRAYFTSGTQLSYNGFSATVL